MRKTTTAAGNPRWTCRLLDIPSVTPYGPVSRVVHTVRDPANAKVVECDVLITGGSTGGVAAALALARQGKKACLVEETDWLGGQFSSQGVPALDEHDLIESFGGTASYYEYRERVRRFYRDDPRLSSGMRLRGDLNPGRGWVSRLCFEPRYGHAAVIRMLAASATPPHIFLRTKPYRALVRNGRIKAVRCYHFLNGQETEFRAAYFLDATEMGDLLELAGEDWVVGAESREMTGEPDALPGPSRPELHQSLTYPFCVRWRTEALSASTRKPPGYAVYREKQPYTLMHYYADGRGWIRYWMFRKGRGAMGPFWTYRRLFCGKQFGGRSPEDDLALINWPGNDFRGCIFGVGPDELALTLQQAQRLSLGFLRWLQVECPRDDGGTGYPEIQLDASAMGTRHGLSKYPYLRESRRMLARRRVRQQHIARRFQQGARAAFFEDSVGIGWYAIDIHAGGSEESAVSEAAAPFQIPLGALISARLDNLIPACKNIGVTHIANGAYRLQPVEWNIGEAAGMLAVFCLDRAAEPGQIWTRKRQLHALQAKLLSCGIPLFWLADIPVTDPLFVKVQQLAMRGIWPVDPNDLCLHPEEPPSAAELSGLRLPGGGTAHAVRTKRQLVELLAHLEVQRTDR
jgi:hypothetical protein